MLRAALSPSPTWTLGGPSARFPVPPLPHLKSLHHTSKKRSEQMAGAGFRTMGGLKEWPGSDRDVWGKDGVDEAAGHP